MNETLTSGFRFESHLDGSDWFVRAKDEAVKTFVGVGVGAGFCDSLND